jgi:hypothetical protein
VGSFNQGSRCITSSLLGAMIFTLPVTPAGWQERLQHLKQNGRRAPLDQQGVGSLPLVGGQPICLPAKDPAGRQRRLE